MLRGKDIFEGARESVAKNTLPLELVKGINDETQEALEQEMIEQDRKRFFVDGLVNGGWQFSVSPSGSFDWNISLFQNYIGVDIVRILESENIPLQSNASFIVQLQGNILIIFDGKSKESILSYNIESKDIKEENFLKAPQNNNYLINFYMDYEDSLPEDTE